jgi:hypothetical protein
MTGPILHTGQFWVAYQKLFEFEGMDLISFLSEYHISRPVMTYFDKGITMSEPQVWKLVVN